MTITKKVSELTLDELDFCVAYCENIEVGICRGGYLAKSWSITMHPYSAKSYSPSQDYEDGGEIIEREKITVWSPDGISWFASDNNNESGKVSGKTFLEAAMRCYVIVKLGREVTIPKELKAA